MVGRAQHPTMVRLRCHTPITKQKDAPKDILFSF